MLGVDLMGKIKAILEQKSGKKELDAHYAKGKLIVDTADLDLNKHFQVEHKGRYPEPKHFRNFCIGILHSGQPDSLASFVVSCLFRRQVFGCIWWTVRW